MPHKPPKKGECLPPHEPNEMSRRYVENGILNGFTHKQIANVIDVCEDTLRKHYAKELASGKEVLINKATDRLRQAFLFNDEMLQKDPRTVAQSVQFFLNAKGGWKQQAQLDQNTTLTVDEALVDQIKNMDFDNIIALGKGLDKLEGQ